MIGTTEIIIIALVVLLLFGGAKIPQLMKGIGKGIHEYKKGLSGEGINEEEMSKDKDEK
ncbi:MAG: twin-arginine translocase TatA/TatE family subunit [Paludibacteraceae bacterium]|nr:twin-arginine translocase TatA/TatE family subunit [Paludibacteraceae bacterium]